MAASEDSAGRRAALLVATDTYSDPGLRRLRAPADDVEALAGVLADPAIGGFEVRQVLNRSTPDVLEAIEGFFAGARLTDLMLLYISGHGVLSPDRSLYFATASTDLKLLRSTAVADGFVAGSMGHCRARSIVLILDCCHSGAFAKGLAPKSPLNVDVEHRFAGRGHVTLTASSELEYAFEEGAIEALGASAPGSLFTRFLVEGLRTGEADIDEDGEVSVDELYTYAYDRVRARAPHQTPGRSAAGHGDLVIARSVRPASLSPALRQALGSTLAGVRLAAVTELARHWSEHGGTRAPAVEAALRRAADDPNPEVSGAARSALAAPRQVPDLPPVPAGNGQGRPEPSGDRTRSSQAEPDPVQRRDDAAAGSSDAPERPSDAAAAQEEPRSPAPPPDMPAAPPDVPPLARVRSTEPPAHSRTSRRSLWLALMLIAALGGGVVAIISLTGSDPPPPAAHTVIKAGDGPDGVAVGRGAVWVANSVSDTVSRIDPARKVEVGQPVPVGDHPTSVAVGEGAVWVANQADDTVSRIDPVRNRTVGNPIPVGDAPVDVAVGEGSVWVANRQDSTVSRIDPAKNRVIGEPIALGTSLKPGAVAVGAGSVWTANSGGRDSVSRIDPEAPSHVGVRIALPVEASAEDVAVGEGGVWVAGDSQVVRIDPGSSKVAATYPHSANDVATGGSAVWINDREGEGRVLQLDPKTGRAKRTLDIQLQLGRLSLGAGALWGTGRDSDTFARIEI